MHKNRSLRYRMSISKLLCLQKPPVSQYVLQIKMVMLNSLFLAQKPLRNGKRCWNTEPVFWKQNL